MRLKSMWVRARAPVLLIVVNRPPGGHTGWDGYTLATSPVSSRTVGSTTVGPAPSDGRGAAGSAQL